MFEFRILALMSERMVVAYGLPKAIAGMDEKIENFHEISWKFRFFQVGEISFASQKKRVKFP